MKEGAFKRGRTTGGRCCSGIVDLLCRELGDLSPRTFAHRAAASEDLLRRIRIHRKLEKHRGCVNTVSFNADGNILVSGSDDHMVILWDWDAGISKLSFHSGHSNNVFQARFMPYTDDQIIVTCAADGEVRYAHIQEGGQVDTALLGQHEGRAHKLAIEPGSPHIFYSCGEDGIVQHFDLRTKSATKLFTCKSFHNASRYEAIVHLNAITIDPRNPNLFAIAGTDEYARVYDIRKYKWDGSTDSGYPTNCFCPPHLIGDDNVGITGLAFSVSSELLASYNNEFIYLFSKDQGLGPNPVSDSSMSERVDDCDSSKFSLSPSSSASASAGSQCGPQVYKGHRNRDTVKGASFFGPYSEYVTSGSDCGRIFIWRKKDGELLRVMEGDKYVVNCIESHPSAAVIASSGIEYDVKIWTPNATEPAPPINFDEVLPDDSFELDDSDFGFQYEYEYEYYYDYGDNDDDNIVLNYDLDIDDFGNDDDNYHGYCDCCDDESHNDFHCNCDGDDHYCNCDDDDDNHDDDDDDDDHDNDDDNNDNNDGMDVQPPAEDP